LKNQVTANYQNGSGVVNWPMCTYMCRVGTEVSTL